jgi:hypothetical protein
VNDGASIVKPTQRLCLRGVRRGQYPALCHPFAYLGIEEVTFIDLIDGHARGKAGYRKIVFCGEQADRNGLRYFWVDSCCMDKRNNTELTKAINSMFRLYRNAVKCYVYLSDVSASAIGLSAENCQSVWEADFRKSRWVAFARLGP